jgi:glyoxylase-like metal-dependent hydrolase (beta-lactamase superfamily II)
VAHELDAVYLEKGDSEVTAAAWYGENQPVINIDFKISGERAMFNLGSIEITALHTPGHTPGSIVLMVNSGGKKILFGQDVHGPLHPALKSDRDDYIRSLKLLLTLEADILCEGHYGVISGNEHVKDFIRSFIS